MGWLKRLFGYVKWLKVGFAAGKGQRHRWMIRRDTFLVCQSGVRGFSSPEEAEEDFDSFVESIKSGAYTKSYSGVDRGE